MGNLELPTNFSCFITGASLLVLLLSLASTIRAIYTTHKPHIRAYSMSITHRSRCCSFATQIQSMHTCGAVNMGGSMRIMVCTNPGPRASLPTITSPLNTVLQFHNVICASRELYFRELSSGSILGSFNFRCNIVTVMQRDSSAAPWIRRRI